MKTLVVSGSSVKSTLSSDSGDWKTFVPNCVPDHIYVRGGGETEISGTMQQRQLIFRLARLLQKHTSINLRLIMGLPALMCVISL